MTNAVSLAQMGSVSPSWRNRIINGDFRIDQRNAGAGVTPAAGQYLVDRWMVDMSQASKFTAQQNAGSVTPPSGFANYLGFTVGASANVTVGASDYFLLQQKIEGFNTADLAWGTASAASVTVSFWVRSSLTGTFGGSIVNNVSFNRCYPFTYTISAANTWEQKTVTIAGDTSGSWSATSGASVSIRFSIGMGSSNSGTAGAWAAANYSSATGCVNLISTNSATFYITGVQLEKGSTATSFDYRPYSTELALCQTYYETGVVAQRTNGTGSGGNGTFVQYSVTKRANATVVFVSPVYAYGCSNIAATGFTSGFECYVSATGACAYSSGWTSTAEL